MRRAGHALSARLVRRWARPLLGAVLAAVCLPSISGCGKKSAPSAGAAASADPVSPPSARDLPTTDGTIAMGNLDGQIQALEGDVARNPRRVDSRLELADLKAQRGLFTANVADYEAVLDLTGVAVRDFPQRADAWIARARARTTLHLFADAAADLAEAERRGAQPSQTASARATILQSTGDLDAALVIRKAATQSATDITALGAEAALLGELGRYDEAEALFHRALTSANTVSPFPIAWLLFQEGIIWERAGNASRARAFLAAALARIPSYAHAASHLAALEKGPRSIELLTKAAAVSDDPEIELLLGQRLRDAGDAKANDRLAHVRARYEDLVAKHPEAYAEHAGFYWLDEGKDPAKALALAKQNLAVRKTAKAYELAVLAAVAAGAREDACKIGTEALARPHPTGMLRGIVADACAKR